MQQDVKNTNCKIQDVNEHRISPEDITQWAQTKDEVLTKYDTESLADKYFEILPCQLPAVGIVSPQLLAVPLSPVMNMLAD